MEDLFRTCLWRNFGAVIDMLHHAIEECPGESWEKESRFFYLAYHTTIFLDYYLTQPVMDFKPALSYTIVDESKIPLGAVDDVLPDKRYTQQDMMTYLVAVRHKCKELILLTPQEKFGQRWIADEEIDRHGLCPGLVTGYNLIEILLYNFRHVQHHVGQLNMLLRQQANIGAEWISLVD